jgi:hypothetical protein
MSNTSPAESRTSEIAKGWLGILVVGGLAWYYFGGGLEKQADQDLYRIETKVAQDSVQEYEIANRHGSKIDICVHAGLVAAAYIFRPKMNRIYQRWKSVERKDCAAAGMPAQ